jgi:hypothetical protein
MPLEARLKMWSKGFFSASWFRYEFYLGKNKEYDYVSDLQENLRASRVTLPSYTKYVDDKVIFPLFFANLCPVVHNYAFILNNRLLPLSKSLIINSPDNLLTLLSSGQDIVIKPVEGSLGSHVHKLYFKNDEGFFWNGKHIERDDLIKKLSNLNFNIICPWIKQAKYAEKFYPFTTNTVRILTVIDPETNEAFVAHSVQRIGTKRSFPVDNFHAGGISCHIDSNTGIIGKGSYMYPVESCKTWYSHHPETGEVIEGVQIPHWDNIITSILRVANSVSFLKIIGWDLIVLDNQEHGFVLLEGNDGADFKVHQIHGGFLKDKKIRDAMKGYNII